MLNEMGLTSEQSLLLILARLTFTQENEEDLNDLLTKKLDWESIMMMAMKNKVLQLIWHNLRQRGHEYKMPPHMSQIAKFYYLGTKLRNERYQTEIARISVMAFNHGITIAPLKGALLIPELYKDLGLRISGDADFLVRKADEKKINTIMTTLGYIQGDYDPGSHQIIPVSREKLLLWKMKMTSIYHYLMFDANEYCDFFWIDFAVAYDYDLNYDMATIALEAAEQDGQKNVRLRQDDFLLHLCCHLYKEAYNPVNVFLYKDLNLIKFIDVREYCLKHQFTSSFYESLAEKASKSGCENAVFFTFHFLSIMYDDGYEKQMLEKLQISDEDIVLNCYGRRDYGKSKIWKKSFCERLFSLNNADEIDETPVYL